MAGSPDALRPSRPAAVLPDLLCWLDLLTQPGALRVGARTVPSLIIQVDSRRPGLCIVYMGM